MISTFKPPDLTIPVCVHHSLEILASIAVQFFHVLVLIKISYELLYFLLNFCTYMSQYIFLFLLNYELDFSVICICKNPEHLLALYCCCYFLFIINIIIHST